MKNTTLLFLLFTVVCSEMMAEDLHRRGPFIVLEEYPEEAFYEIRPAEERLRQWQAAFARGEISNGNVKDPQNKRSVDIINSLLALPKGLNEAGRR